jgi:hypothetical protein
VLCDYVISFYYQIYEVDNSITSHLTKQKTKSKNILSNLSEVMLLVTNAGRPQTQTIWFQILSFKTSIPFLALLEVKFKKIKHPQMVSPVFLNSHSQLQLEKKSH